MGINKQPRGYIAMTSDSIWIGWHKNNWTCNILAHHKQYLHMRMENMGGYSFNIVVVYMDCSPIKWRELWAKLVDIKNSIGTEESIIGGISPKSFSRMKEMAAECLISRASEDLVRQPNGLGKNHTQLRLDRTFANLEWVTKWPQVDRESSMAQQDIMPYNNQSYLRWKREKGPTNSIIVGLGIKNLMTSLKLLSQCQ